MLQENLQGQDTAYRKILVTGGSGLTGNELIRQLLDAGERVVAIEHTAPVSLSHPHLQKIPCSILDVTGISEVMREVTHVYHCAALVSYNPSDRFSLLKINIEGTANIVNACIDAGVKKLVHVSSVSALGRNRKEETVSEQMNWSEETSNSTYGKSKYLGEMEVWRGIGEGLPAVIVNPTLILGGENWESGSSSIFKKAFDEFAWYTEGVSGFVDVRDVARAMILLMNSEITSGRFILNGENLSYREIFSWIAACFGKQPPRKKVTPFMAAMIWRAGAVRTLVTGKKQMLTRETVRTAQAKVYFDNSKILKALPGFQFTRIKDTIAFTCSALKKKYKM